jgi:hypothetical protein
MSRWIVVSVLFGMSLVAAGGDPEPQPANSKSRPAQISVLESAGQALGEDQGVHGPERGRSRVSDPELG